MNLLNKLNIKIILSWDHAHSDEKGNELAVRLAKLAMMNYYQSKRWKDIEPINSLNNWNNINIKAVKKENKRKAMKIIYKKWNELKKKKNNIKFDESLTKYLIIFDINYNEVFKYEMKKLKGQCFKLLTQLRAGHNHLNGQRKWGNNNKCYIENCEKKETLIHFLFECKHNYQIKMDLLNEIEQIYQNKFKFINLSNIQKLNYILFPFNYELKQKDIKNNKAKKLQIYEKRLKILNLLYDYCIYSGRFDELFDYKYKIKTW